MKVTLSREHVARIAPLLEPVTPLSPPREDGMTDLDPQISIAISLKRIADAMTGLAGPLNAYGEGIGECIQGQHERGMRGIPNP